MSDVRLDPEKKDEKISAPATKPFVEGSIHTGHAFFSVADDKIIAAAKVKQRRLTALEEKKTHISHCFTNINNLIDELKNRASESTLLFKTDHLSDIQSQFATLQLEYNYFAGNNSLNLSKTFSAAISTCRSLSKKKKPIDLNDATITNAANKLRGYRDQISFGFTLVYQNEALKIEMETPEAVITKKEQARACVML